MKTKIRSSLLIAGFALAATSCSDDWGKMDPPAGNQVYPTLETVATLDFDAEEGLDPLVFNLVAYPDGQFPEVITDDMVESPVLSLSNGYARIANPLNSVTCQKAASMTFWVKQLSDSIFDEEGEFLGLGIQDVKSPLLHWENGDASSTLDFSTNGWWSYKGAQGSWSENNPADYKTGYLTPDEWHYCALVLRDTGYAIYIDGKKKADVTTETDFTGAVQLMAQAPYIYLNYGADTHANFLIDDITFYRNEIASKQFTAPKKGKIDFSEKVPGGEEDEYPVVDPLLGNEDNTTGFWTVWSPYISLTGDGTMHYEFTNFTAGNNNWENWGLVITNGLERGGDGYTEYLYMRADNYGWASLYNGDHNQCDFNWDTFKAEMNGAKVVMDITREGNKVTVTNVITAKDGTVRHYSTYIEGDLPATIGSFLTVEGGHLMMDVDKTFVGKVYPEGTRFVGKEDFTNGFWSDWSKMEKMDSEFDKFGFEFVNHSEGGGNYQFWNLVVTNGYQSAPDGQRDPAYSEWYYLRCDAYGWGGSYATSTMTQSFAWDTYIADMMEATSHIYFSWKDNTLTMVDHEVTASGKALPEYRFVTPDITLPIGLIFTCEHSWLEIRKIGYFPWIDLRPKE